MLIDLAIRRDSHSVVVESDPVIEGSGILAGQTIIRRPRTVVQVGTPILLGSNILLAGVVVRRPRAALSFILAEPGSLGLIVNEVPGGAINGVNDTFATLYGFTGLLVYLNGLRQHEGDDYNILNNTMFSLASPPLVGDSLLVDYLR